MPLDIRHRTAPTTRHHRAPKVDGARSGETLVETAHVRRLLRFPNTGKTLPEARWTPPSGVGWAEAAVTLQAGTTVSARALVVEMERRETAKETWGVEQRRYSRAGVRAQQLPLWNRKYSNDQPLLLPVTYPGSRTRGISGNPDHNSVGGPMSSPILQMSRDSVMLTVTQKTARAIIAAPVVLLSGETHSTGREVSATRSLPNCSLPPNHSVRNSRQRSPIRSLIREAKLKPLR